MSTTAALPFDFADDMVVDFGNPFLNPLGASKNTMGEKPLTPVSNTLSRSSSGSSVSLADKRVKREDDDDQTAPQKRMKSDADDGKDDKRQVLLQKNRVAAQKCREKKKKETAGMMERCERLERENEKLKYETKLLTEETNNLKMMIMGHVGSTPGCGYFNEWIDSQAQAVINKKRNHYAADSLEPQVSDPSRRNESIASATSSTGATFPPHQEPLFNFDDELDAQAASWSMQSQSLVSMDASFVSPMDSYSTVSLRALEGCEPIDPSLEMAFSPVVKVESSHSDHGLPGGGTPETLGGSPQPTLRTPSLEGE